MSDSEYDEIILGQGLAGSALAWNLDWRGRRILVIDRDEAITSSRVAAGLMTPITGQRLVRNWRWDQFWSTAVTFYRRVEAKTATNFFDTQKTVRLLATPEEQEFLALRLKSDFASLITRPTPLVNRDWFEDSLSGFEMSAGGRLSVANFLDASRLQFSKSDQFRTAEVDLERDVEMTASGVRLPRLGVTAKRLIFCQGIDAIRNPWFRNVVFKPAKGELLTVRIEGLAEERIVSRGVWLMPIGNQLFRAGATYEWSKLDCEPTDLGREEICSRLREFLRLPFEVVEQTAAIRPILLHQYPVVGIHPEFSQLGYFNGLGSKGALQAPWLADHFASVLTGEGTLDTNVDLHQYERSLKKGTRR